MPESPASRKRPVDDASGQRRPEKQQKTAQSSASLSSSSFSASAEPVQIFCGQCKRQRLSEKEAAAGKKIKFSSDGKVAAILSADETTALVSLRFEASSDYKHDEAMRFHLKKNEASGTAGEYTIVSRVGGAPASSQTVRLMLSGDKKMVLSGQVKADLQCGSPATYTFQKILAQSSSNFDPNVDNRQKFLRLGQELQTFASQEVATAAELQQPGKSATALATIANQLKAVLKHVLQNMQNSESATTLTSMASGMAAPAKGKGKRGSFPVGWQPFGYGGAGAGASGSSSSSSSAAAPALGASSASSQHLHASGAEVKRVCVIGATGTGKSSLVNALLGEKLAKTGGAGAAVTSVPTEFYYRPSPPQEVLSGLNTTTKYGSGRDVLGELVTMDYQRYLPGAPVLRPKFRVGLKFLDAAQAKDLLMGAVEELFSLTVTKTEKKNDVVPILKLLFSRVPPGNVQQQYLYSEETDWACEIEPGRSNEGMVERRRTEFLQRSTRLLASYCSNPIPNSRGDELLPLVFRAELYGAQLIGKTFTSEVYTLDTLRALEEKYWRILEHVSIGGEFPLLNLPGCALRLIDVPGFGDECGMREKVAEKYLHKADKIVICAASARAGSDRQTKEYLKKDAVQQLQMKNVGRNTTVFVATKSDHVPRDELAAFDNVRAAAASSSSSSSTAGRANVNNSSRSGALGGSQLSQDDPFADDLDDPFADEVAEDPAHKLNRQRKAYREQVKANIKRMLQDFKYGKEIPVHVVSSEKYMALSGMNQNADDGFTQDQTEIPDLAQFIFRSIWREVNADVEQKLKDLLNFGKEKVEALENPNRDQNEQDTDTEDLREFVEKIFDEVTTRIRHTDTRLRDVVEDLKEEIGNLHRWIKKAARYANQAAPGCVDEWGRLHWGTYAATLRKGGVHSGAKGISDFHSDLFRKFRTTLQDEGWSDFFGNWQDHLQNFDTKVEELWQHIVEEMGKELVNNTTVEINAATASAEKRRLIQKETKKRSDRIKIKDKVAPQLRALKKDVEGIQDSFDHPKEALQDEYSSQYSTIGHGESGTGSHARRKTRVAALLADGCKMDENIDDLLQECNNAKQTAANLAQQLQDAVWNSARACLTRGSWSVDTRECQICMDSESDKRWVVLYHCQHAFHEECLRDHMQQGASGDLCPYCRQPIDVDLMETIEGKKKTQMEPAEQSNTNKQKMKNIIDGCSRILEDRSASCGRARGRE